jgi:hypothetical protein
MRKALWAVALVLLAAAWYFKLPALGYYWVNTRLASPDWVGRSVNLA